jgi:sugar lactone lactonase YvrE
MNALRPMTLAFLFMTFLLSIRLGAQTAQITIPGSSVVNLANGFAQPYGVALDKSGNLFVVQDGSGSSAPSGPGLYEILASSGYTTVAPLASGSFVEPYGVALDASGNVFVTDLSSDTLSEVLAPAYTTVVPLATFGFPVCVAVDADGNAFVADLGSAAVDEVVRAGGYKDVIALGSGWMRPTGVAVDGNGTVYVADQGYAAVQEMTAASGYSTVAPIGPAIFNQADAVAVDSGGNLYVADYGTESVTEIVAAGGYTTTTPLLSDVGDTEGIAVDPKGDVFTAENDNNAVQEIVAAPTPVTSLNFGTISLGSTAQTLTLEFTFTSGGTILAPAVLTQGVAGQDFLNAGTGTCAAGNYGSGANCTVSVSFMPRFAGARNGAVELLNSAAVPIVMAYVTGVGSGPQIGFAPPKETTLASGFNLPQGVAVDGAGNVVVGDTGSNAVEEIPAGGGAAKTLGSGFSQPQGVAVDGAGNVFVADAGNSAVKEILAPQYTTVNTLGSGFDRPTAVQVDGNGDVYVEDTGDDSEKEILFAGGYTTVITLTSGITFPSATKAVAANGNLFIADTYNNRVLKQDYADAPSVSFANTVVGATSTDSPKTVALENLGNQDIVVSGVIYPTDFSGAGQGANPCILATELLPGRQCDVTIYFTPQAPGNLVESVTPQYNLPNAPGAQLAITASGTATPAASKAALTSPAPGTVLSGSSVLFTWTGAAHASGYSLWLGSTGVGSSNLYDSHATTGTAVTVTGLPVNGETIYARIYTIVNGAALYNDYTYTAASLSPAVLSSPAAGGILPGPNAAFSWSAVSGATGYSIWVGSAGVGSSDLYKGATVTGTSISVGNLPINEETVYIRLNTSFNGVLVSNDYVYTAALPGALSSPAPGFALPGSTVTFSWTPGLGNVTGYSLWIGTSGIGSHNLYDSGATTGTSVTVKNLPTDGINIYVSLHTFLNGVTETTNQTYIAQ